jgi:hypothetical protein
MKPFKLITIPILVVLLNSPARAQQDMCNYIESLSFDGSENAVKKQKHLNFFIISAPKKGKLDLGSRFNIVRSKLKSLFRPKKFVAIVAKDMQTASAKVQYRLNRSDSHIGTLWFDGHGSYKKGYAVFHTGKDEFNYHSVKDPVYIKPLQELATYTDEKSKVVIGSCYGGATFFRKSLYSNDTIRMNGDSLMMGLGGIFSQSTIYASESWVMTKPGLFQRKASVAGHPLARLYKDIVYRPAWENMGKWNEYNGLKESFCSVNPVTMDIYGNLMIRSDSYAGKTSVKNKIKKVLKKLRPGLLKSK